MSSITDHYSAGEAAVQALAAGCDDNNKEALAFDLSTDEWSFAKEGGHAKPDRFSPRSVEGFRETGLVHADPGGCRKIAGSQDQLLGQYRKKARGNACADLWR